jgi:hypothetical protein
VANLRHVEVEVTKQTFNGDGLTGCCEIAPKK